MSSTNTAPSLSTATVTGGKSGKAPGDHLDKPTRRKKPRDKPERVNWGTTIVLFLCTVTVLLPLYVTIMMAFKTSSQSVDGNAFSVPTPISVQGFIDAWQLTDAPVGFAISVFVTAGTVIITILVASAASFAIIRNWHKRLFKWSFFYLLGAMFIPFPVVALPQIQLTGRLGLDNPIGVVLLASMFQLSFSVLLFTAFLRSIPMELEESARIDGASTWQVFWRLVFPLLAPMSATVGIFAFLYAWNDFMMPSLIISDPALQTLPVRQNLFQTQFSSNYNVAFASYLMAMAPAIIAYLFAQRWVMEGVTQGAVKG
ncbi:carbohydrate ABC transporter permease [Bogoriella caseilytica]|uniref:Carbohydrate ABC transporter membrane protein 2 (CUT1 family) n=1 Tax=Bogoriella caseilytica TaxID=56055 RepID=A0A3N2BDK5_9MICO|nr:carbohydrate ABC transporter permease [Bogoriella caseilytica]ROR73315.1 carbohydrate ABC transporter membrane protein 2 (CUT1 family) [Bogoriella caseilytica]